MRGRSLNGRAAGVRTVTACEGLSGGDRHEGSARRALVCPEDGGTPSWLPVMSDFDDLIPRYADTDTGAEAKGWFAASGLQDVQVLARPTAIRGRKPIAVLAAGG
jgi:hypothetical protein